ncbi:hypothetical protein [Flavobacterium sp. LC2016-12]|uniref:hypothetical protein n=1 Tax=Flavobacterium sp. LC2016-12 TaxID=2783794 RepID=UPI00188C542C|nr:hypothetical protein [Flavobacterium sp. LC2016-12]MBF4464999.1 hypothetical protein [Flavobacterium sp. LC2016-12]
MVDKKDIEKLIIQSKKSNLITHFKDSQSYNTTKYSGEIRNNEILIWRSAYFIRGVYPIFHLTFDQNNKLKEIKMEKNPFNIFLDRVTIVVLIILIVTVFISTNLITTIFAILAITLIGFLMRLLLSKSKIFETKILIEELKTTINNLEGLNNSKQKKDQNLENEKVNEWSFSKIMSRILIYPFCVILIWLSVTLMIPEGKIIEGIFAIIVGLAYPISDLLIIINKKNYS